MSANLKQLEYLYLGRTPLQDSLPPEVRYQSAQEIIRYVLERQSTAPKRYFNESKVVVVGQGDVGKSCVINRLIYDKFDNQHPTTHGVDIEYWRFTDKTDGQEYTLNVWDFGGQEIYHATHQFFLTRRTLYLLVWDTRTEDDYGRRDYWMRTIQSFAADSPVVIVVNKCDIREQEVEYEFIKRYPQIKREFYISCKRDGDPGLAELRRYVRAESVKLPLMKEVWTEVKLSIRERLEARSKEDNYIYYDEYGRICAAQGLTEEIDQKSLIKQLHDLGIVLYYHDDSLLRGLVILNPQWGTRAVYKVLDEKEGVLKGREGILYYADLRKIWGGNKQDRTLYPEGLYPHLLKLMERFQLAFKVDNPKLPADTYLVAELLSIQPVPHDWPEEGKEPLAFRYTYDFLPAGVMTRLIVSIHEYLETIDDVKQCWRKGAYLAHGSARARMTLYDGVDRKYVDIRVTGDDPRERRELLTVVRSHVKKINDGFNKIEITEQIPCRCSPDCPHFFKYGTLRKAERMGKAVQCPESLEDVSPLELLDGVEAMDWLETHGRKGMMETDGRRDEMETDADRLRRDWMKEDRREYQYGNIYAQTVFTGDVNGNPDIRARTETPVKDDSGESKEPEKKDPSEKAANWSEALFKFFLALVLLLIIVIGVDLLLTGQITLLELFKHALENMPGG